MRRSTVRSSLVCSAWFRARAKRLITRGGEPQVPARSMTNEALRAGAENAIPVSPRAPASSPSAGVAPRIWLVLGDKAGDNAQVRIVAETLGWPYAIKQLTFR